MTKIHLKDINISNIKVAVFDFDNTLAIHKDIDYDKRRNETNEKRLDYYLNAYKNPSLFYDEIEVCEKSETMYNLITLLRNKNIKIYCLSGMKFSFHLKAKQSFVDKYYGNDIEVISASSQELKLDGIKIIQKLNNCSLNEILFVDDRIDVVDLLARDGVKAFCINDII